LPTRPGTTARELLVVEESFADLILAVPPSFVADATAVADYDQNVDRIVVGLGLAPWLLS